MKKLIYSAAASIAVVIAYAGVYPASWFGYYEPQIPEELIK